MSETIKVYKGTDKDMKCHGGFQYELGKTYEDDGAIRCGNKGFHSCEAPLDVLNYFKPGDGSRYFTAEAGGKVDRTDAEDSKIASSKLILKAEIGLPGLVKAQAEYVKTVCKDAPEKIAQGDRGHAAAQGYSGHAAAQGDRGHAAAQGDWGHAETYGKNSIAAAFGRGGKAKAPKDCWIMLAEYDDYGNLRLVRTEKVDGEIIKEDTWYTLNNGEITEVK